MLKKYRTPGPRRNAHDWMYRGWNSLVFGWVCLNCKVEILHVVRRPSKYTKILYIGDDYEYTCSEVMFSLVMET